MVFEEYFKKKKIRNKKKKDERLFNMICENYIWHTRFIKQQVRYILNRWKTLFEDRECLDYKTWMQCITNKKKDNNKG